MPAKARRILQEQGWSGLARRLRGVIYPRRTMIIHVQDLTQDLSVPFFPRQCFVGRLLNESDLHLIAPHVTPWRLAHYRRRLAHGMVLGAALSGDERECFGWMWSTDQPYYEPY